MKNVNIKKVVAGAAALAIAAGSLGAVVSAANVADSSYTTPNGLARADMFNAQGAPSYNIVVGSTGHASDVVWAANIAAAIGKKAYNVSTASATGGDVVVEVGAESTSTSITDGKLFDDFTLATTGATQSLTHTNYSSLVRMDVEVDIDGSTTTLSNVADSIKLTAAPTVYFEINEDVRELLMQIPTDVVKYELDLKGGINFKDGSGNATITVGGDHDITIPFMGKMYKVRSINSTGTKIELVSEENTLIQTQGSEFSVSDGYTVRVGTVTDGGASDNRVLLELLENGSVVSTKVVRDGRSESFGGLIDEITITSINYADNQNSFIEVSTASEVFTLENDTVVDEFTGADDREWKAILDNTGNGNTNLVKITISNEDEWFDILDTDAYPALRVGESAVLPGTLGSIEFVGLSNEDMYYFKTDGGRLKWMDNNDNEFDIPMYVDSSRSGSQTITVDGIDYYVHFISATNIKVSDSSDVADDGIDGIIGTRTAGVWAYSPAVEELTALELDDAGDGDFVFGIPSDLDSDVIHYYQLVPHGATRFGIALHAKAGHKYELASSDNVWTFAGTDAAGNAAAVADTDYFTGVAARETDVAIFTITEEKSTGNDETINLFVDPNTKRLISSDKYTGNAAYNAKAKYDGFNLDDYQSEDLREGITLRGSEISISGGNFLINQPKEFRKVEYAIGGGSTSSTTMIGDQVTLTTPGEVVDADGIKVKLVSAPQGSATTYTPAAFGNIAYLDTDTLPAGNKIIVGGWMVNEEAKNLGLQDLVTKAGDFVAGKNAQGNIVVAGFHKEDTANAAKELISAIEAMN